jgi:hypothetical protein
VTSDPTLYYGAAIEGGYDSIAGGFQDDWLIGDQESAVTNGQYSAIVGGDDTIAGDQLSAVAFGSGSISGEDDSIAGGSGDDTIVGDQGTATARGVDSHP